MKKIHARRISQNAKFMPNSCAIHAAIHAALRAAIRAAFRAVFRAATHAPKHFFHALDSGRQFFHAPMHISFCLWPWPVAGMANGHGHKQTLMAMGA